MRLKKISDNVYNKMTGIKKYDGVVNFDEANWGKDAYHHRGDLREDDTPEDYDENEYDGAQ